MGEKCSEDLLLLTGLYGSWSWSKLFYYCKVRNRIGGTLVPQTDIWGGNGKGHNDAICHNLYCASPQKSVTMAYWFIFSSYVLQEHTFVYILFQSLIPCVLFFFSDKPFTGPSIFYNGHLYYLSRPCYSWFHCCLWPSWGEVVFSSPIIYISRVKSISGIGARVLTS